MFGNLSVNFIKILESQGNDRLKMFYQLTCFVKKSYVSESSLKHNFKFGGGTLHNQ